nr:bifunctional nuclease family protein [Prochlorococcus sp. MIT 1300]
MVEMSVAGLALDASNRTPIVLLRDPSGRRQVPIWIDHAQAHNILAGIKGTHLERPLSHDLMVDLLHAGNLHLEKVIIHAIEANTFQAILKISPVTKDETENNEKPKALLDVDARPSDAIALAVRTNCGIWMLEKVVGEASIPVDAEADEEDQDKFRRFLDEVSPAALVRHLKSRTPKGEEPSDPEDKSTK